MENPYKKLSKINPQRENGNRQIANDVFKALIMAKLSGAEYQIVFLILDKTWGFKKTSDGISYSQIAKITKLTRRGTIKTIKKLETRRIILVNQSSPINEYLFNKHYDTWLDKTSEPEFTNLEIDQIRKKTNLVNQSSPPPSEQTDTTLVNCGIHTKETLTKETIYITNTDKIMIAYQRKFPEQRKLFGLGGIVRAREYFEGIMLQGIDMEEILEAIERSTSATPWEIISHKIKKKGGRIL